MKSPEIQDALDAGFPTRGPMHLAIGMFDGVHLGHQAVIEAAVHAARRDRGEAAVLTFDPHPSRLFKPEAPTLQITDWGMKAHRLAQAGVDRIIRQPFDEAFASREAEDFPAYLKRCLPGLIAIYVGENFRFGRGRRGDIDLLVRHARAIGLAVYSVERIRHNGEPISSTRIRSALAEGRIEEVNALLGYTYTTPLTIEPGRALGRTIGFPTLNGVWEPELKPCLGVYAVLVRRLGERRAFPAVANYGLRPTVESSPVKPLVEIHLLGGCPGPDWQAPIALLVEWHAFIRRERQFDGLGSLREQIALDVVWANNYWASHNPN